MGTGNLTIDEVSGDEGLREFCLFADEVNRHRSAYWPVIPDMHLPLLKGVGPISVDRQVLPLVARADGVIVATVAAVVDQRYIDHWSEPLGHLVMFEALPDTAAAVRELMNEACGWLKGKGMEAARTGMGPGMDMPYLLDSYESLPPFVSRQNPPYYHFLLKEARFEAEKGWVDYKIEVTPERVRLWEHMLSATEEAGYQVATLTELGEPRPIAQIASLWGEAFAHHWGMSPQSEDEWADQLAMVGAIGGYDVSIMAHHGAEPVGVLFGMPDLSQLATVSNGRELRSDERLNMVGIGVRSSARGRGVNLALVARSFLELVKAGSTHLSYTLVLDDNWPSRRTAEKLGGQVCANYMVYRRLLKGRV
ncbi:MAG: GNAT family N-acetyltransferase [Nitrososphaerales archaeon]